MPPRRSSRAPGPAEDPAPVDSLPTKRKRGQTAEPNVENENATKPASRARRSVSVKPSSIAASGSRRSTRSKVSLPDVAESGGEEQEDAPPVKKARPSVDSGAEDRVKVEGGEGATVSKPRRGKRTASLAKAPQDIEMDVDEDAEPPQRASRRASKNALSSGSRISRTSTKSSAASGTSLITEAGEDEEDEEEEFKPIKGRRAANKPSKRGSTKAAQSDEDDGEESAPYEDDEDDVVQPARKGRKAKANVAHKGKIPAKKATKTVVEDSDEEISAPAPALSRVAAKKASDKPAAPEEEEEEEEEEKSLFEPASAIPAPSSLPPPVLEEPTGPKSRLVIHKMALVNFKSYAGRQEIGPFHKSFSSIVGPNGSGKSNTIDALLFVFGYRASKMRQGKISELIHNSANHPDLDECSVEVHFRDIIDLPGPDAFKLVPDSQLVVTRSAYKNNSSKYTINGRVSSYKEVQALLKGRGIDLDHNRFLILQGEVESIAQMKPKAPSEHEDGLLEYLEDIIGTSKYKEPIDEALIEMERLQEDRQMKLNRLRHVEKEKLALEAKKKEAEDYLRLKNDLVRALSRQYQWYLWRGFTSEEKLSTKKDEFESELAQERGRHQSDIEHLESLREHYVEQQKAYEEVQTAANKAVKELAEHEKREIGLQEKMKHASARAKKLKKSVQEDTAARKTAQNTIQDSTSKMKKEKIKLEEYEISLEAEEKVLEEIRDSLKDKTQVFHDKIQIKQKELQPWTAQINAKQAELDVAISERDALAKKAESLKSQCQEANETFKVLQEEYKNKMARQDELKVEKKRLQQDIQTAEHNHKGAQDRVTEWRGKAATSRNKVEEAKASQSENRSQNNVLTALNRLRDEGKVEGFHGRLGSLGTIPDKYDVAISTACGSNLNFMVVDKVHEAQTCIEHLRKNGVGRASFMVLEKLPANGPERVNPPEGVPRLFDLVKPNSPTLASAFYKAMGNTLVANDMDQANRIAFSGKRWRVVTLDGGLIETSGAMSGGGNSVSRGAMSSKQAAASVSPATMKAYERDSEQAHQELQKASTDLREYEAELERLKTKGPAIDLEFQKIGMDIENMKTRIAQAEKRVKELNSQNKPNTGDLARISALETGISASQVALDKLQGKTVQIDQDIKDLEKKILDIGGSKLLTQKSKVDGIRLHITLANDELTKAEISKKKSEKDVIKLDNNLTTNKADLEVVEAELVELVKTVEELNVYVSDLKEEVENAQTAEENSKEELKKLKKGLDEQEECIAEFRKREAKLKHDLAEIEKEIVNNSRMIDEYNAKHEALVLEDVDEEDEDEEAEPEAQVGGEEKQAPETDAENGDDDTPVKTEEGVKSAPHGKATSGPSRSKRQSTPSNELRVYSTDELRKCKRDELVADVAYLDEKINNSKPDLTVLTEYKQRELEFFNRAKDLDSITVERDAQKSKYDGLRKQRLDEFMAGFNLISLKLKEMYQMITLGGNAELELVDSLDPFSEGIIFSVMPPKKSWKNISNLSGGEKTLSSLALVFALHVFKPTPLYFMDEIDAALDFRNVSIVANYIKDRTKNAQFIIISLRNDMFELSHRLIGIYKTSNATRSISIDNHALQATIPKPRPQPPSTQATG